MNKTTAREIKVSCLGWLRFARQMPYVATEFQNGMHVADVFAANSELSVEIEVKVSTSDYRQEFEKWKHRNVTHMLDRWPNKFYFAVPIAMGDFVLKDMASRDPSFGLITYNSGEVYGSEFKSWLRLSVVKRAGWLHREPPKTEELRRILMRMVSEIYGYHEAERAYGSVMSTVRTAIDVAMIAHDQHPKPSIETVEEMP